MQTITRHGGGSHYVRPDRIYRTGVIQSAMGYDPGQDVQDVAASFVAYPMDLQAPANGDGGMSGLRGFGFGASNLSLLQRMKLRYDAWKARRALKLQAQQVAGFHFTQGMSGLRGLGHYGMYGLGDGDARQTGVAYPQVGMSLAPPEVNRRDMAQILMSGNMAPGLAVAQAGKSWNRWVNMRWNG
jgi:hypothetical protein